MAYDDGLAVRIRDVLAGEAGVTERKMFGGLGFMVEGHMAVAASSSRDLMVRVDPAASHDWIDDVDVRPMEMGERTLNGWLLVSLDSLGSEVDLRRWVGRGVRFVRSLPPK